MSLHQRSAPRRLMGVSAAAACIALVVAGCSNSPSTSSPAGTAASGTPTSAPATPTSGPTGSAGSSTGSTYGFTTVAQDPTAKITVWVDADRSAIAEAFEKDHPECPLNIETYDASAGGSDTFHTKVSLLDQAGSGWPDVAWSGQVNDASWAAHEQNGVQAFAAPLDQGVVPQSWLDGYTPGALDPVTVDGHVYGARDNLAPVVLWYNKTLFDKFGYTVPTTWEEYQALGDKVAAEHPGYILGSIGDPFTAVLTDMWAAQAPIYTVDGTTFTSDFSDSHTTRMIALLDHMFANKTLAIDGLFTPDWVKKWKDKVLAIPGPTWFTGALFQNKDNIGGQPGEWGAGHALHWAGEPIAHRQRGWRLLVRVEPLGEPRMRGYLPAVRDERTPVGQAHHGPPGLRLDRKCVVGRADHVVASGPTRTRSRTSSVRQPTTSGRAGVPRSPSVPSLRGRRS